MHSIEMSQNGECVDDTSTEADDSFGYPVALPRVGEEYQAKVPTLISKREYIFYTDNPIDEEKNSTLDFLGVPIPVMWITNIEQESGESFGDSNDGLNQSEWSDKMRKYRGSCFCLVPGSSCAPFSEIEKASFVLGLYIFEKNFIQVRKIFEVKKMEDITAYYYGKFYRSNEYRRWSARNIRYKRCAYGQRIFSGLRQQELLSRIFHHVSEECQNALLEVSKAFGEGKILLEEYVSCLIARVGIEVLVDSVGIGKGKKDLTGISMETSRSNQVVRTRPEIPIGKACASLTCSEITKFLCGDYRLSKARSYDLFWEAVWPRLLARGWQSQEPEDQGYAASSKSSLVFLMPGIKKFSKRTLSKGVHYFDSVTDVLGKVASEPGLLKLDDEEYEGNKNKEQYEWTNEIKVEEDASPERQRHCYLQPRTASRDADLTKFTVVDMRLNDGKTSRLRKLRSLPLETSKVRRRSKDSSYVSTDSSGSINQEGANNYPNRKRLKTISDVGVPSLSNDLSKGQEVGNARKTFKKGIKDGKTNLSHRLKQDDVDGSIPVAKRTRSAETGECNETAIFSVGTSSEQVTQSCCSGTINTNENILPQWIQSKSSSKDSPRESTGVSQNNNFHHEEPHPRELIDLNLPLPQDLEAGPVMDSGKSIEADEQDAPKMSVVLEERQQQPSDGNLRRHSTRNRPPTARVLEAFANGFLTTNRRPRVKETRRPKTSGSSHSVEGANGGNSEVRQEFADKSEANAGL